MNLQCEEESESRGRGRAERGRIETKRGLEKERERRERRARAEREKRERERERRESDERKTERIVLESLQHLRPYSGVQLQHLQLICGCPSGVSLAQAPRFLTHAPKGGRGWVPKAALPARQLGLSVSETSCLPARQLGLSVSETLRLLVGANSTI